MSGNNKSLIQRLWAVLRNGTDPNFSHTEEKILRIETAVQEIEIRRNNAKK